MPETTRKTDEPETPDYAELEQAFRRFGAALEPLGAAIRAGTKAFTEAFNASIEASKVDTDKTTESDT